MKKAKVFCVCVFAVLSFLTAQLFASDIAYDNFGPDYTHASWGSWFGARTIDPDTIYTAGTSFVSEINGYLDSLTLAIDDIHRRSNVNFNLSLFTDHQGILGTQFWSQTFTYDFYANEVFHAEGIGGPWLNSGTKYWLVADGTGLLPELTWRSNDQNVYGDVLLICDVPEEPFTIYENVVNRAMKVEVVVPEPATLAFLAVGAILAGRVRK